MNFKFLLNLKILSFLILIFIDTSSAGGCNFNNIKCISCPDYQVCSTRIPESSTFECPNAKNCTNAEVVQCWMKLKCYAPFGVGECTQTGIFPDLMSDSGYYVCLNGPNGFVKYDFVCPEGNIFDQIQLLCTPRTTDSPSTESPASPTTSSNSSTTARSNSSTTSPTPSTTSTPLTTPELTTTPTPPTTPDPTTTPTPTTTPDPTTTPTPPTTPEPTTNPTYSTTVSTSSTTPSPFVCSSSGVFPDSNNCKMYYKCSVTLQMFHYICPGPSYFNENTLKCSLIITPLCKEQISKNSTTVNLY